MVTQLRMRRRKKSQKVKNDMRVRFWENLEDSADETQLYFFFYKNKNWASLMKLAHCLQRQVNITCDHI